MNLSITNILKNSKSKIGRNLYRKPKAVIKLLLNINKYCSHICYFPEKKRKGKFCIFWDNLIQILKFGDINEYYFSYGFDVKTQEEMSRYLHYAEFFRIRNRKNYTQHGVTAVLRNKFLFGMFCDYLDVDSGNNIGILSDSKVFVNETKTKINLKEFCNKNDGDFFIKLIDGECGCGIFSMSINNKSNTSITINGHASDCIQIEKMTKGANYLIQRKIKQHPLMSKLHADSLNTIRLVTVINPVTKNPEVFPSILRIGTGDSIVDNTSQGGIAVGINLETGRLKEYGFFKPQYGTKVSSHPDSGIKFSEFIIPFFDECKRKAVFLHSMLPSIHSIGWDIAIGPEGPIFVEGNDNWEINGPQICNGGLKEKFLSYCG